MTTDQDIEYDRSLLGVEHPVGSFEVTKDMIVDFARSTGETNPVYLDEEQAAQSRYGGIIAPPTFCNIFISGGKRPDPGIKFGDLSFFAGQAIESLEPVRPGDTLEASTRLKEVYAKTGRSGKMVFAVWETGLTNQNGETVALVRESFVRRNRSRR